ncbi:glycosyl transferase family 1 [Parazoarcus communis]|uniref:Glycosyl transferase family 1 n=1 Tax=Parazoarcus communis TaxID=41977 RepID=A0A2U8H3R0_9RHOO|nr:glycosyltransferase [Parazoarcus communis]AWI79846.1 glycosyl transferase family 1 [Parazoarcus communis]
MNILMISDVFFPRINGVSTSIETFRNSLKAHGIHSSLIAPAYPQDGGRSTDDLIRIPSRFIPLDPEDRMMRRSAIREQIESLKQQHFDLVHIHTPFVAHYAGLELAKALDLPCVGTYHTFFEEYLFHYVPFVPRAWLRGAARRFSRQQCNGLDAVIVPSRAMADTLAGYGVNAPVHILPTGIPEHQFHGGDGCHFRQRYDIPKSRRLLLFVGRVAHEKNIDFLIDMVGELRKTEPAAMLLVTGEGPALGSLRTKVERAGLSEHIRFLGYLDRHNELHDCYRAADVFVFASRTETQGLVLLEAMALGTPVVALAEMGTVDILAPQQGCRIAPNNPARFAEVVGQLLSDCRQLQQLGVDAREYAQQWHTEEMSRRLGALYETWVADHQRQAAQLSAA